MHAVPENVHRLLPRAPGARTLQQLGRDLDEDRGAEEEVGSADRPRVAVGGRRCLQRCSRCSEARADERAFLRRCVQNGRPVASARSMRLIRKSRASRWVTTPLRSVEADRSLVRLLVSSVAGGGIRSPRARLRLDRDRDANGPACTPGSVRGSRGTRGRSSLSATRCRAAPAAYPGLGEPRRHPLSGLAPDEVYLAGRVTTTPWSLTPPFHPYPGPDGPRRSALCGTVSRIAPGGRYPPSCPVEPGRSSARANP